MYKTLNQPIDIEAYYFSPDGHGLKSYPRQIAYEGRHLSFESGLRVLVRKGQDILQIFTMTDGTNNYRLSFEPNQNEWKLLGVF
jgi:hypothetical protein